VISKSIGINGSGAIYNQGQVDLVGVDVLDTQTDTRTVLNGNIITNDNGRLNISDSSIVNSNTYAIGNTGELNVSNSTIAKNLGAGIASSESGELNISNSTIVNNNNPFLNRSIGISNSGNANVTSSLIDSYDGSFTSAENNLIAQSNGDNGFTNGENGNIVGTIENPIDPKLGELQDNGGATLTQELLAGSPAIDTGSNPDGLATDQRGEGFNRTVGEGTDIGAFEVQNDAGGGEIPDELVVSTLEDENDGDFGAGDLSLREAILNSSDGNTITTITFDSSLSNGTITLSLGELLIDKSLNIEGLGSENLTIDANQQSRVFNIDDGDAARKINVGIDGLKITGGNVQTASDDNASKGGGILNQENLTLADANLTNNKATEGGGIYNLEATANITNSHVDSNSGSGIYNDLSILNISNSSVSRNDPESFSELGNGVLNSGNLDVSNTTVNDNDGSGIRTVQGSGTSTISNSNVTGNKDVGVSSIDADRVRLM
jgi:hypothetical protein